MRFAAWLFVLVSVLSLSCRRESAMVVSDSPNNTASAQQDAAGTSSSKRTSSDGASAPSGAAEVVRLDAMQLTAPANWARKAIDSPFVAAEFALPRAAGDTVDGRLTISTAGGSVEANIDRWKGQFKPEPKLAKQETLEIGAWKATIVDFSGDFNDQRGPFAPGELRPGYRMLAGVIAVDGQLHFIKATGPEKTIAANADAIQQFIRSAKPVH